MEELRFNSALDIIGSVMTGPSSSHTAGAARIGKVIHSIFGRQPGSVDIYLYKSFTKTYHDHGTDIALVGGLLGMESDNEQLSNSLKTAYEQGMEICFISGSEKADHPNSARIVVSSGGRELSVTEASIGDGSVQISELNGLRLSLSMDTPAFTVAHQDVPGMTVKVTSIPPTSDINISIMTVIRESKREKAIMIIEADQAEAGDIVMQLAETPHIHSVNYSDQMNVKE